MLLTEAHQGQDGLGGGGGALWAWEGFAAKIIGITNSTYR